MDAATKTKVGSPWAKPEDWLPLLSEHCSVSPQQARTALEILSNAYPRTVLSMLHRFGFRLRLTDFEKPLLPAPAGEKLLGKTCFNAQVQDFSARSGIGGYTDPLTKDIGVGGATCEDPLVFASNLVHEVAHALAYVLGSDGFYLSEAPSWQQLFQVQAQSSFPTPLFSVDSNELFAEVVTTIVLGTNVKPNPRIANYTKDALQKNFPALYEAGREVLAKLITSDLDLDVQDRSPYAFACARAQLASSLLKAHGNKPQLIGRYLSALLPLVGTSQNSQQRQTHAQTMVETCLAVANQLPALRPLAEMMKQSTLDILNAADCP